MSWQPNKNICNDYKTYSNYKQFNACIGGKDAKDIKEWKHICKAAIWIE